MATDTDTSTTTTTDEKSSSSADTAGSNGSADTTSTTDDKPDSDPAKELEKWKSLARKHENANEKLAKELETIKASTMSEQEKAIEKAKAEGRAEARAEAVADMVTTTVESVASAKLADPAFASLLTADDRERFVTKDGKVDRKAIEAAIDGLVKRHPQVAPAGTKPRALAGGAQTQSSGFSMNDEIRRRAGR
jgi:hypothetical protein